MTNEINTFSGMTTEEIYKKLNTSKDGISSEEVLVRQGQNGLNIISEKKELGIVLEFLSHFKSPMIIILMFAAAISAYFGQTFNAIVIIAMILASVILDFFEEHSANNAAKKLREKVSTTSTVIRNGKKVEIKSTEICTGDILFLSSGDLIPADAKVIEADDFFVNQSVLTGESFPKEKAPIIIEANSENNEFENVLFSGSSVISGNGLAVVFAVGKQTEFGRIAEKLLKKEVKSDFELGVINFGYLIMKLVLALVVFIFLFNSIINKNILDSFIFAVAIAVGVTPELLPMIMSVTMSRGSLRMSKRGVIVKKLDSIPNFGSMDILCTDKTGTLTEDKIQLVKYTNITGESNEKVLLYTYLNSFFETGIKNPLDSAVVEYKKTEIVGYKKVEEIPFDFVRKMMSIVVEGKEGTVMITKGAPEDIMERCSVYHDKDQLVNLTPGAKEKALKFYEQLSADGFRVLAVAIKSDLEKKNKYTHQDENSLELLGFVSFLDPAKKDVAKVLGELEKIGIEIKIVTGDNEFVTKRICEDVGLVVRCVLLGKDSDKMTDAEMKFAVEKTTIFARFSPDQKDRVIRVLKSNNHVVGYMGDGINDAPSLKIADVGISVDTAVDVAKESADIILTTKSLESIVGGVIEGRRSFGNTMKYIIMGLSSNFGNMFSVAGAIFYIPFLPMLPIQILLNNFLYDFSQITIPSDKVDNEWVERPRKWDLKMIKRFMYTFGPISSIFDFATFFVLFSVFHVGQSAFQTGWFMESLATQTLVIHIIRTRKIPFLQSRASNYLMLTSFLAVAVGWILPYTPAGDLFKLTPLPFNILCVIVGLVIAYLILVEIFKRVFFKKFGFMGKE